jgi:hypothetical protein
MSRKKQTSRVLTKAQVRLASLKAISPEPNLGAGLSVSEYAVVINDLRQTIEAYNTLLANTDNLQTRIKSLETVLADLSEKMLLGVAHVYGKDSEEYELAGGVRKSDRKRPTRKPKGGDSQVLAPA